MSPKNKQTAALNKKILSLTCVVELTFAVSVKAYYVEYLVLRHNYDTYCRCSNQ